jgi:hypothetical protein
LPSTAWCACTLRRTTADRPTRHPGWQAPGFSRFSPSGDLLAVGHLDAPIVSVASGRDLSSAVPGSHRHAHEQVNLSTVVWSSDGNYLYAGGDFHGSGLNPLYRWPDAGRGQPERIPLMRNRITEIQQMPNGQIAFAAEDPGLGILAPNGRLVGYRGPDIVNFSELGLTSTCRPMDRSSRTRSRRTVRCARVSPRSAAETSRRKPRPQCRCFRRGLRARGGHSRLAERLQANHQRQDSGTRRLRDVAVVCDRSRRKARAARDRVGHSPCRSAGEEVWYQSLPAVAWAVNISQNGEVAIAALSDGTVRWYRMRDGREIISYFPHGNGLDWMAWTPDGYYTSSVNGDNYVGWHLNRGKDLAPDFYRAVQFDRILYRPDVVNETFRLALATVRPRLRRRSRCNLQDRPAAPDCAAAHQAAAAGAAGAGRRRPRATLRLEGEKNALAIKDYAVFVNGIPVTPSRSARSPAATPTVSRARWKSICRRRRTTSASKPSTASRWARPSLHRSAE